VKRIKLNKGVTLGSVTLKNKQSTHTVESRHPAKALQLNDALQLNEDNVQVKK